MSNATLKERPLSPHLSIYKTIPTMAMSILHRITGVALYIGSLFLAWWLLAIATGGNAYASATGFFGSPIGLLILIGYTWALLHHLLGGLRHFLWDTGHGMEKDTATTIAIATLVGSLGLTVLLWLVWLIV